MGRARRDKGVHEGIQGRERFSVRQRPEGSWGVLQGLLREGELVENFKGRAKSRLAYGRLTWQGLGNAGTHVSVVLMVVYAVAVAAYRIGRPVLRQSIAFFA